MQVSDGTAASTSQSAAILIQSNAGNLTSAIVKSNVKSVNGTFVASVMSPPARFPIIATVTIQLNDSSNLSIRLQEVTNQSGWVYTQAGVTQAVTDITTWLSTT
jgi:hypothetical protein